jgi:hypothetical protein
VDAQNGEVKALEASLRKLPGLSGVVAKDANRPSNLPYCVLSAIFSINAKSVVWQNVVTNYRRFYHLPPTRLMDVPPGASEPAISEFIAQIENGGSQRFANVVVRNRMRTSTQSGILKAEASLRYARVLRAYGIERREDVLGFFDNSQLEWALRGVHGQGSGISTDWFFMNAGDKTRVKYDRRLITFLHRTLRRNVRRSDALALFRAVSPMFEAEYPGITPRALDLLVWVAEGKASSHVVA